MGLIFNDLKNLLTLSAIQPGAQVITLGRQCVYLHPRDLWTFSRFNDKTKQWCKAYKWGEYCERFFFDVMEVASVDSVDYSNYEQATLIHDLGEPLPVELFGKFDLVVDGGTLEHIFNFPTAVRNFMQLVKVGGVTYMVGPCNNLTGHGFYQFSPDLIFRIFARENGFSLITVRLALANIRCIDPQMARFVEYEVVDPVAVKDRVTLMSKRPVQILAMARRVADCPPFRSKVLQSDYLLAWDGYRENRSEHVKEFVRSRFPKTVVTVLRRWSQIRRASVRHKKHFKRVS